MECVNRLKHLAQMGSLGLSACALGCGGQSLTEGSGESSERRDLALERQPYAGDPLDQTALREADSGHAALVWESCADGFECARLSVPLDYTQPHGNHLSVAVTRLLARDPARRIGSLFTNFGGPGGDAVGALHEFGKDLFATLNERFDIIGFDPRGTGQTDGAIDCRVDQEAEGMYAAPFTTPVDFDEDAWLERAQSYVDACLAENGTDAFSHVSTADVARDMDSLRVALGERRLSYLGFSYGTFLGATYAALYPHHYRALVLDGALDADQYINHPTDGLRAQTAGFERALDRFFEACVGNTDACFGFGGADPHLAFDRLVDAANEHPIDVPGNARPLSGDAISFAISGMLYAKQGWSFLAESLAAAEKGDPSLLRMLADYSYGLLEDGSFDPGLDRYFALSAAEQVYDSDPAIYIESGYASWSTFTHFSFNTGYSELPYALFHHESRGAHHGPFVASPDAPTILVVATTYDPATPYRGSERLVQSLGNARLLTMLGDGHTAYGGNSPCIDAAVDAYLVDGVLPDVGTECAQQVPFEAPPPDPDTMALAVGGEPSLSAAVGTRRATPPPSRERWAAPAARTAAASLRRRARLLRVPAPSTP
jgi:pimeloyl-ACP methyl ester carboxylesterase